MQADPVKETFVEATHRAQPTTVKSSSLARQYHKQRDEPHHGKADSWTEVTTDYDQRQE
jgi:hypothetical protein